MLNTKTPSCHPAWIGVDVGKESLVAYIAATGETQTIDNKRTAIISFLRGCAGASLVLEATGGYEAVLIEAAIKAGHTVYRVNARRVRAFMESVGIYAKTDAIDAKALADYAAANAQRLRPFALPCPIMKELRQCARRRDELVVLRTQETNRLQAPDNVLLRPSIKAVLECLDRQIDEMERRIQLLVETTPLLQKKLGVLTAVKGVGFVTAVNLLVAMPELGELDRKQVAALAGLAPFPRDSGKRKGYRRTRGGRVEVRRALYMAALSASRYNEDLKIFYNRLIDNGKKPLQAIIATARKLLVILNAKLRDAALNQTV